jgi:hypothetical protein
MSEVRFGTSAFGEYSSSQTASINNVLDFHFIYLNTPISLIIEIRQYLECDIWGSPGGKYENCCLLICDVV